LPGHGTTDRVKAPLEKPHLEPGSVAHHLATPGRIPDQIHVDLDDAGAGSSQAVDWQKGWDAGWTPSYSPFAKGKDAQGQGGNFSDFLVKLGAADVKGGFDKLGKALFGAKDAGKGAPKR